MRVFVTNLNKRFTGVSATTAAVLKEHQRLGCPVTLVGYALEGCSPPVSIPEARQLSRAAAQNGEQVIWHVRRNQEMRHAIVTKSIFRIPIKSVFTSAAIRLHSWYPRQLIAQMDAVIATSAEAATFVPNVKAVIPHGVDTERFRPTSEKTASLNALGFAATHTIATVGRIRPEKGTDRFVEAMIKLLPDRPTVGALIVGTATGPHKSYEMSLRKKVDQAGLSHRIIFTGEWPNHKMPELMGSIDMLVQLPRYEGYGMTVLEAMASGVPFVASPTGAFEVFSQDGQCGQIVHGDDYVEIASEIAAVLDWPLQRSKNHAQFCRKIAQERFSVKSEASLVLEIYKSVSADADLMDRSAIGGRP